MMKLTELEEKELNERETDIQDRIDSLQSRISVMKETLETIVVCRTSGHVWPKSSPDYYYCDRCGSYLG